MRAYGAAAVLVIIMLEAFGMPLPGESLLIFSAALAGRGEMSLPALLIGAWPRQSTDGKVIGRIFLSQVGKWMWASNDHEGRTPDYGDEATWRRAKRRCTS